jgi:hypothetical protein
MRFSTLTVVVFVAYTSTQAIAAPLPISDDIQELVARADNKNKNKASTNWSKVATSVAQGLPPQLLNVPVKSNFGSAVQKAVSAAKNSGTSQNHFRPPPMPQKPAPSTGRKTGSVQGQFNKLNRPSPSSPMVNKAIADLHKARTQPVTTALEQRKKSRVS